MCFTYYISKYVQLVQVREKHFCEMKICRDAQKKEEANKGRDEGVNLCSVYPYILCDIILEKGPLHAGFNFEICAFKVSLR